MSLKAESNNSDIEDNKDIDDLQNIVLLPYYFKKNSTSEDPSFPLTNLEEKNISNGGWISQQNCTYPQKIIAKFDKYVNVKQINILINEKKIPTMIKLINCIQLEENESNTKDKYRYEDIGYIKLSSNEDTDYSSREFRKIKVNVYNTNRIKILIYENYENPFNSYNQVGIVLLEFYGYIINNENGSKIAKLNEENYSEEIKNEKEYINIKENNDKLPQIDENVNLLIKDSKKKIKLMKIKKIKNNHNINKNGIKDIKSINNSYSIYNINNTEKKNYNSNIIMKTAHLKYIGKPNNIENKQKSLIILDEKMDKMKKVIEENEKEIFNQENKQFKRLQNQIYELKEILNKIYKEKGLTKKKIFSLEKESNKQINNINNCKGKTMINNIQISNLNRRKTQTLSPLHSNSYKKHSNTNRVSNQQNIKLKKKQLKISSNDENLPRSNFMSFDNLPPLNLKKRPNCYNSDSENEKNNNYDSLNDMNDDEIEDDKSLDEIPSDIKEKIEILIEVLGEDIFKKIFSKNIYNQEEGFNFLIQEVKDIIIFNSQNMEETNKYIVSLINIIIYFLDNKHYIIILMSLELFLNILKAIEEKSNLCKKEYNFKISKNIIIKIKEKLNHVSKRIRLKATEIYCYMLDSNFCDFYLLVNELIENEANEYYSRMDNLNNRLNNLKMNKSQDINKNQNNVKMESDNLIMTKMNIYLKIFNNYEYKIKKFNVKKFPHKILGDYLIMNINHSNEKIREITKNVLVKYINIFGNDIFYKLKLVIGNKELTKIIHDNNDLINEMKKFEIDRGLKIKESNILINKKKINDKLPSIDILKVSSLNNNLDIGNLYSPYSNKFKNRYLIKNSSQPKLRISSKTNLQNIN